MATTSHPQAWSLAAYRAHNDRLATKFPEVETERTAKAARAQLAEARRLLRRGRVESALQVVIDTLEGAIGR